MNLRDKLKRLETAKPRQQPQSPPLPQGEMWIQHHCFPVEDSRLDIAAIQLMMDDALPEHLSPRNILFLDTETTGLSGGAGTLAFLIGTGRLTDEGFLVTQYMLRDYPDESPVLQLIRNEISSAAALCTFNGKSFDMPLLHTRMLMNKLPPPRETLPHIDLLHLARRVWKPRLKRCTLGSLEERVLGTPRQDDLPGSQVPERYFHYLKTGQRELLTPVLTHNRQDIYSLWILLQRMAQLYHAPEKLQHGEDLLSMGRSLVRRKHHPQAIRCFQLISSEKFAGMGRWHLSTSYRQMGDVAQAVQVWLDMVARREGGYHPYVELAKHYEHRVKDIPLALHYTQKAMMMLGEPTLVPEDESVQFARSALQYRCDRLMKKARRSDNQQ